MLRRIAVFVAVLTLVGVMAWFSPASAHSYQHHHHHHKHHRHGGHSSSSSDNSSGDSGSTDGGGSTDSNDSSAADDGSGSTASEGGSPKTDSGSMDATPTAAPAATGSEKLVTFRITGFGAKDNTPPGSTTISMPVIHKQAGGTGTFADPLTAATPGHSGKGTENPKGTKFYVPGIQRYVIVEDSGASKFSQPHLDIWSGTTSNVEDCEGKITKTEQIIENPSPNHPVKAGPIATGSGCNI